MQQSFLMATSIACLWLVSQADLFADSYRCGRKLIRSGDTSGTVQRVCGEPLYKDRGSESVTIDGLSKTVPVERWYYKKSARSLERIVLLYRGRVVEIEVGGR
jgi:hypothetical protein